MDNALHGELNKLNNHQRPRTQQLQEKQQSKYFTRIASAFRQAQ